MQTDIKQLIKNSLVYSGGSFVGKFITFCMLPLTTSYLTPGDYRIIGMLTIIPLLLDGLFSLGYNTSLARTYFAIKNEREREGVIWTAFFSLTVNAVFWTILAFFFSKEISLFLLQSPDYTYLVQVTFWGTAITAVRLPLEFYLRAKERVKLVAWLNVIKVLVAIQMIIFMVMIIDRQAAGFIEAATMSQAFNLVLLLLIIAPQLRCSFYKEHLLEMLRVGYPYIYGLLGYFVLQCSSRYMLELYADETEVGLYCVGSNFSKVIELPQLGFISAWIPFYNKFIHRQREAPPVFSKILSYYVIGMSCVVACFFCFAKPVVYLLTQPLYYSVWTVVGTLALAQALWGVYVISYPPLIFLKRTALLSFLEISAGGVNILLSMLLIPFFQKEGAAVATLLAFVYLITCSLILNRRALPVPYETKRILKTILALGCVAALTMTPIEHLPTYVLTMIGGLIAFLGYIWVSILTPEEQLTVKKLIPQQHLVKQEV